MSNDKDYQHLIHTNAYKTLRRIQLTKHPFCQRCEEQGKIVAATDVHHIQPVEDAVTYNEKRSLMFDPSNLMSLCHRCHVQEHIEMGSMQSKERAKRRTEKQMKRFNEKFFR